MPAAAQPSHMVQFELRRALNAFRNESVSELAGYVDRIARNMKYERSSVNNAISTMHAYIAQGFYAEVMAAYKSSSIDRTHPYRWTGSAPYRRYAKGAMERALSSEGMVSYDNRSMILIGRESLDQIARQWYRLNFGAGTKGKGGRQPEVKKWKMGRKSISMTLSLAEFGPSGGFFVPHSRVHTRVNGPLAASNTAGLAARRAARKEGGVGDGPGFYLLPVAGGKKVRNPYSAGFRGHHFLEAGVDYVNAEYPKQLYSILDTWFRTAKDSAGRRKPFVWSPRK